MNPIRFSTRMFREAPDASSGASTATAEPVTTAEPTNTPAAPDFSWAGEQFLENGTLKVDDFRQHYESLSAAEAARAAAAAAVPEAYDFAPPADLDLGDLKLPEGVDLSVKADDPAYKPLFDELGTFLRENGLPQEAATKVTGLLSKYEATKFRAGYEAAQKDYEALGPTDTAREQRLATVKRALESKLPADQAAALLGAAGSLKAVQALEKLAGTTGLGTPPTTPPTAADDPLARRYSNSPR